MLPALPARAPAAGYRRGPDFSALGVLRFVPPFCALRARVPRLAALQGMPGLVRGPWGVGAAVR